MMQLRRRVLSGWLRLPAVQVPKAEPEPSITYHVHRSVWVLYEMCVGVFATI
jgi:hypothetical protein